MSTAVRRLLLCWRSSLQIPAAIPAKHKSFKTQGIKHPYIPSTSKEHGRMMCLNLRYAMEPLTLSNKIAVKGCSKFICPPCKKLQCATQSHGYSHAKEACLSLLSQATYLVLNICTHMHYPTALTWTITFFFAILPMYTPSNNALWALQVVQVNKAWRVL